MWSDTRDDVRISKAEVIHKNLEAPQHHAREVGSMPPAKTMGLTGMDLIPRLQHVNILGVKPEKTSRACLWRPNHGDLAQMMKIG
jgi:hypothetical protein